VNDTQHRATQARLNQGPTQRRLRASRPEADGVEVEQVTVEGAAPRVLLEQAEDAELLVVGSRGLGGFRGLLLGSVSQQCAHHAQCPVVVVPTPHGA
jgi:nucleotide-binding universal stress UspA family protein